jgi:hypothetical protein
LNAAFALVKLNLLPEEQSLKIATRMLRLYEFQSRGKRMKWLRWALSNPSTIADFYSILDGQLDRILEAMVGDIFGHLSKACRIDRRMRR